MASDELARLKRAFFNRPAVTRFLDAKTRKVLSKFGAFVRRRAQTSMRPDRSNRPSPPGSPPKARGKKLLRRLLFFAYDQSRRTVYIGPLRLSRTAEEHVPRVLEEGGTIARQVRPGVRKTQRYRARPFMKPAFDKEIGWVASEYRKQTASI